MNFDEKKNYYLKVIVDKISKNKQNCAYFDLSDFGLNRREETRVSFLNWLDEIEGISAKTLARAVIEIKVTKNFLEEQGV